MTTTVAVISRFRPNEPVIRYRGGVRDENGQFTTETAHTLLAIAVAPTGGSDRVERARSGEDVDCTVYFPMGTDIVNGDELTVRGKRFQIVVNDWKIDDNPVGGMEVLCIRGQG